MASRLTGAKRKGEDLEQDQPQKKPKISILSSAMDHLDKDCWGIISEYLPIESASSLYFASKSFRRAHDHLVAAYLNRAHGFSNDLAPLLPTSVSKSVSKIGNIVLFEKATSLAKAKNYSGLAEVLKKIQLLAKKEQLIYRNINSITSGVMEEKQLRSVYYSDFYRKDQSVGDDSDSEAADTRLRSAFIWLGMDRRYLDVKCEYWSTYTHGDSQGWLEFKVTVVLKQLGVTNDGETIVFAFKKDPTDTSGSYTIMDCIFEKDNDLDSYDNGKFFNDDEVRKVTDWLKVDLVRNENSPKAFMKALLYLAINQLTHFTKTADGTAEGFEKIRFNEYDTEYLDLEGEGIEVAELLRKYNDDIKEFNGDMAKEISHLMSSYLNGEDIWVSKTLFVVDRLLLKCDLIDCINNRAKIGSDDAKEELIDVFGRADILDCTRKSDQFEIPRTEYNKKRSVFCKNQYVQLILHPLNNASPYHLTIEVENEGDAKDFTSDFSLKLKSDKGECEDFFVQSAKEFTDEFGAKESGIGNYLLSMNLSHVTRNDWLEFFLAYLNPPELSCGEIEDEDEDEENNEEEDDENDKDEDEKENDEEEDNEEEKDGDENDEEEDDN